MSTCKGVNEATGGGKGDWEGQAMPSCPKGLTLHHTPVGSVCDGIDVGWHLVPLLALVHFHDLFRVNRQVLVRIDDHTEKA
jgi:hypothetical protein